MGPCDPGWNVDFILLFLTRTIMTIGATKLYIVNECDRHAVGRTERIAEYTALTFNVSRVKYELVLKCGIQRPIRNETSTRLSCVNFSLAVRG